MSREIKLKYFLEGKEVEKEVIDWNRSLSVSPIKNSNEVHVTYLNFEAKPIAKTTPACGLSTRHKACGQGYPAIKIDKDKLKNFLKKNEDFSNAVWTNTIFKDFEEADRAFAAQKEIGTPATPYIKTHGNQEERDIDSFVKFAEKFIGILPTDTKRTSSADELKMTYPRPRPITTEDLAKAREALNKSTEPQVLGVKHNKHKAPLDIVQTRQFGKALQMIALATAFGNKKYEATDKDFLNFKRVAGGSQTYFDAAARHNTERNEIDEETGLPHVIHAVWDMLAGLELLIEEREVDVKEFSKEYLEDLHKSK